MMTSSVLVRVLNLRSNLHCVNYNSGISCIKLSQKGLLPASPLSRKFSFFSKSRLYSRHPLNSFCYKKCFISMNQKQFRLNDYDCIGFDLDNTICEYKIKPMVEMEYHVMSKYLVNRRGYEKNDFPPLTPNDIDFMQRGLLLDFEKGNVLKLDEVGSIIKACHGTKELSASEIKKMYGELKKFKYGDELCCDVTCAWKDNLKTEFRLLLDSFDLPASVAFARAVDFIDISRNKTDYFSVGQDILSTLVYMYNRDNFSNGESEYFRNLKADPEKYINKCSPDFRNWLKSVGKGKKLFLVTGSNCDYANFTASYCLGEDWKELFDIVIFYARKPGFFHLERPFLVISNSKECGEVDRFLLKCGHAYSQGNWVGLRDCLSRGFSSKDPKFLYVGDNVVEDIFSPHKMCDTIAISEELSAEKLGTTDFSHSSREYLISKQWGSFFIDSTSNRNTLWGSVIKKYAKACLPSVNTLVTLPC